MSCRATSLSSSLDSTDRFEIGRYDLTSAGSRSGFFNSGVMKAALNALGTTPRRSELLNRLTRNDTSWSILSFSSRVGSGSDVHCLSGSRRTAATTSATVSERKLRNLLSVGAVENFGGGASADDARTAATLSSKN